MTSEGKEALRKTIRTLRASLLEQLQEEAERTYRLGVSAEHAKLPEAKARRRARLEAWLDEQSRAEGAQLEGKKASDKVLEKARGRYLAQAVKEAAHTLLNRLVILRIMEEGALVQPAVVTGGWNSSGYREFQEYAGALCKNPEDGTKGYRVLLHLLFDELSIELPGVFGQVGLTALFPVPAATLREVIEALNQKSLDSVWADDTALGWVYQFWNDPEREALDDKINGGGKIEPHEIASKTQMFTERYMVEWLLQNSLGQTWLAMCKKHGWTPDFEQVREGLEQRRAEWRKKRDAGEVAADELMPIHPVGPDGDLEERWKYWVQQPMPADAPAQAPERLADLKLLDPACGSGHFLVIAFDQLASLYREEARHARASVSDEQIAQSIIENNLHGVDIDPRAIQIAAAALWLKAKLFCPKVQIARMNLVAPAFKLAGLSADDAALTELKKRLNAEVGIPESLTAGLVAALDGVDHLGTLLRVDKKVREALSSYEKENFGLGAVQAQTLLFGEEPKEKMQLTLDEAEASVTAQLARFLSAHEGASDLGLRLEGEQLAAGVRFLQLVREGTFDLVVGNPPYQGTSKMAGAAWFKKNYPRSKADLYACFLERGLELVKKGGVSALLTMRGWMFLSSYQAAREHLLQENDLRSIGDFDRGAFDDVPNEVLAVSACALRKAAPAVVYSVAAQPTPVDDKSYDRERTGRKRAAVLAQVGRFEFDVAKLAGIAGTPLVYWWSEEFLDEYVKAPKLGDVAPVKKGLCTGDDTRWTRRPWEVSRVTLDVEASGPSGMDWFPLIMGGKGAAWFEPLCNVVPWGKSRLALYAFQYTSKGIRLQNVDRYLQLGVAFAMIGASFRARLHRFRSVFGDMGSSVFPSAKLSVEAALSSMNTQASLRTLGSLNPGVHFQVGDVLRLHVQEIEQSDKCVRRLRVAFSLHESRREPSVEFKRPGPSPWRYAQDWAQRAVDRPKGDPLPAYVEELDAPDPTSFVSFAVGVALGRFGEGGEGILGLALQPDAAKSAPSTTGAPATDGLDVPNIEPSPLPEGQEILPHGILFLSAAPHIADSANHPAFRRIEAAWSEHGRAISGGKDASAEEWLRRDFFAYHKALYENRPIYFPLSSEKKNFVAWVSIHRWANDTLAALLAHYLHPAREKLTGEINDLNQARASSDKKAQAAAEKQYAKTQKLVEELEQFIAQVTQLAEKGTPPTDPKCTPRAADTSFRMDLDDGVMVNSAALWPLLEPQWKDPKKWWKELSGGDYDWAHLSARYFPERVDDKCKDDPSLGVAHGCFWKHHPAKAYAWELRLQDEIRPDFTIDEADSDACRAAFLRDHPQEAAEARTKEEQRRERNRKKVERQVDEDSEEEEFELRAD